MTSDNLKESNPWGNEVQLTAEQIILWLENHRALMIEIWKSNPELREKWEKLNSI
jgi:hypothetical protein